MSVLRGRAIVIAGGAQGQSHEDVRRPEWLSALIVVDAIAPPESLLTRPSIAQLHSHFFNPSWRRHSQPHQTYFQENRRA